MYEFFQKEGKLLEGYLSSEEEFNGIVFLLREPNDADPTEFWFKNVLDKKETGQIPSKYVNRFLEMLIATGHADDNTSPEILEKLLRNAVYCNIHPEFGGNSATRSFHKKKRERSRIFLDRFPREHKELTIFTLWDIYDIFLEYLEPVEKASLNGLKYSTRKRCFQTTRDGCKLTVYEIVHPSRSSGIDKKEKTEYCKR